MPWWRWRWPNDWRVWITVPLVRMISSLSWLFTGILKNGKLSSNTREKAELFISISSILESVFSVLQYHPVLENFAEYKTLRRDPVPYNKTAKFGLVPLMIAGRILNKSLRLKKIQKKQDLSGSFLAKLNLESQIIRNSQNQLVSLMTNSYIYSTLYIYNNSLRLLPKALHRRGLHFRCGAIHGQHCGGAEPAE